MLRAVQLVLQVGVGAEPAHFAEIIPVVAKAFYGPDLLGLKMIFDLFSVLLMTIQYSEPWRRIYN